MKACNTVYRVACNDRKVSHLNLSVIDDRHLLNFLEVSRIFLLDLKNETTVDLLDDLVYTRKQSGEQLDRPFLKCLGHDGVVGVSTAFCCDIPCLIPAKTFLIDKNTHQLCNCNCRMSIIHLEYNLLMKLCDVIVCFFVFGNRCLKAGRYEEVLLFQTKLFTCHMVIIRIKHLYDSTCKVLLLYCVVIITLVKRVKVEVYDRLCIPDTKCVYNIVVITCDRHIVRNSLNCLISFMDEFILVLHRIPLNAYISAEMNLFCILRTTELERIAVLQPVIRCLYLITVTDLLLEHTITVTDSASVCTVVESCKRIQEACCQSSKSTVSKSRIRLLVFDAVNVKSKLLKSLPNLTVCTKVDQVVSKGTAHKELHGHIIYDLRVLFFIRLLALEPVVNDHVLHSVAYSLKDLLLCSLFQCFSIKEFYVFFYTFFEFLFLKLLVNH